MQNKWKWITANILATMIITFSLNASEPQEFDSDSAQATEELFAIEDEQAEVEQEVYRLSKEAPELLTEEQATLVQAELERATTPETETEADTDDAARAMWGGNSLYLNSVTFFNEFSYYGQDIVIKLADEVWWKVPAQYIPVFLQWGSTEPLIIVQNHNFKRRNELPFYIVNTLRDEKIEATPSQIPAQLTLKGHCVGQDGVSYLRGVIRLQNGATFKVSTTDDHKIKRWAQDQFIIIGVNHNDSWFYEYYPNLLINGVTGDIVRVNFMGYKK